MALAGIINTVVTLSAWLALSSMLQQCCKVKFLWKITDRTAFPISETHQIKEKVWM